MLEESVSPDPSHVRLITSQGHWEKKKKKRGFLLWIYWSVCSGSFSCGYLDNPKHLNPHA